MQSPSDLKYTREHEWIRIEDGVGAIGITHHAQEALGDIVYVELPSPGARLKAGAVFGVVESIKATSDLFSPVSGSVLEVNAALAEQPERVNRDCYGEGWILKVSMDPDGDAHTLLDADAYDRFLAELG